MADPHVLTGLMAKRAEIAGRTEHLQDQLRQLVIDLDHIDASINAVDPSRARHASAPLSRRRRFGSGQILGEPAVNAILLEVGSAKSLGNGGRCMQRYNILYP